MCYDCGTLYREFPLDTTLPDDQWAAIHERAPGGILCASCIVRRASERIPNAIAGRLVFETDSPLTIIPQAEYDMLRRALFGLWHRLPWQRANNFVIAFCSYVDDAEFFVGVGFLVRDEALTEQFKTSERSAVYVPTPAAHEFTAEMQAKERR
jgi:hypothetical protein